MENVIIVLILIVILALAVPPAIKHMKGEGSCCGGPKEKPKRKSIQGKPLKKITLKIEGMHCNNCRVRLENKLNEFDGVVAHVSLADGEAKLSLYREIDMADIFAAVEKLDFKAYTKE